MHLFAFLFGILMMLVGTFINGYFIMLLWNWFVPGIIGLATMTYAYSCGLAILIAFFFSPRTRLIKDEFKFTGFINGKDKVRQDIELNGIRGLAEESLLDQFSRWLGIIATNAFIVFVGWLIHLMM